MTLGQLTISYLLTALAVGVGGGLLAADRRRSMQIRSAAMWTAMTCLAWPLTLAVLASLAVGEVRRRRTPRVVTTRSTATAGLSFRA